MESGRWCWFVCVSGSYSRGELIWRLFFLLSSDGNRESEIRGMGLPVAVLRHQPGSFVNNARHLGDVWCFGGGRPRIGSSAIQGCRVPRGVTWMREE